MAIDPSLITTIRADQLPTAAITTNSIVMHAIGEVLYQTSIADLSSYVRSQANYLPYEIKILNVENSYVTENFELDGLGKNLWLGWQVMNGNRGTANVDGKSLIGFGTTYNAMKAAGGSANAVVVEHSHGTKYGENGAGSLYPETPYVSNILGGDSQNTTTVGVSGIGKNMPPYLVQLIIMKLP
jgi:hypothetical protein